MDLEDSLVISNGIVEYDGKPYYYIERCVFNREVMILAYNFSKKSLKAFQKSKDWKDLDRANKMVERKVKTVSESVSTPLSKMVRDKLGTKNETSFYVTKYQVPIFVTGITLDKDTVTGRLQEGFREKKANYIGLVAKNSKGKTSIRYPKMIDTGVFIGYEHIRWIGHSVTPEGLTKMASNIYRVYQNAISFNNPLPDSREVYYNKNEASVDGRWEAQDVDNELK